MRIKKMYQGTVPENKILDTYSTSATDTYSCNYVNERCKILWTNSSPASAFASQTIILSSGDYDFYEVFFTYNISSAIQYANGTKTVKGKGLIGAMIGYAAGTLLRRKVDYTDATHLLISSAMNGNSEDNNYMIPIYVIGYKTDTFN